MRTIATTTSRGTLGVKGGLSKKVMQAALVVSAGMFAAGCANDVKQSQELGQWNSTAQRPLVISSKPDHDTKALASADEKLNEADWEELQKLGPKPIWDKLAEFGRKRPAKAAATAPSVSSATTKPSTTVATTLVATTTIATTHPRDLVNVEPVADVPVIPLPDGKIRIIYRLRNYGGSTVSATVDGGTMRRTVVSRAPDLTPLVAVLATNLGDASTVIPLPDENTLIITCAANMKDPVLRMLARIDQAPRQVEITAKMFEVSHDFDFQYGCQLLLQRLAADNSQSLASSFSTRSFLDAIQSTQTGTASADGSILRLMQVFQGSGLSLEGTFQLMSEAGLINVVASPRMTVAAGQTGYMLAGQELPIQSATIVNNATQTTTTYKPVGVQLYITPQAMGPDSVKLHAISIVSAVSGFAPLPSIQRDNASNKLLVNPIIDSREAETSVTIDDGKTLVFGGLRMIRTTSRESKIPGLGDIPGLGWLFKNHHSQKQMTDLYFFVTPTML